MFFSLTCWEPSLIPYSKGDVMLVLLASHSKAEFYCSEMWQNYYRVDIYSRLKTFILENNTAIIVFMHLFKNDNLLAKHKVDGDWFRWFF